MTAIEILQKQLNTVQTRLKLLSDDIEYSKLTYQNNRAEEERLLDEAFDLQKSILLLEGTNGDL